MTGIPRTRALYTGGARGTAAGKGSNNDEGREMAEVIVTEFRRRPVANGRRREFAEPGVAFAVTPRVLAVPEIEWRGGEPAVRLTFLSPGRPVSWAWLALGEPVLVFGRELTLRSAVFDGGRFPDRLVIDLEE